MSEFDSGSGRKGFVRDVMRRISAGAPRDEAGSETNDRAERRVQDEIEALQEALRFFGPDSSEFRRRLDRFLVE